MIKNIILFFPLILSYSISNAQNQPWQGKFEPIDNMISPPNSYRAASGAPGSAYWQQRADYKIKATLNEANNTIRGEETITYYNNSPDDLSYLWIQLEQNVNRKGNEDFGYFNNTIKDSINARQMQFLTRAIDFPAGYTIKYIKDVNGNVLKSLVNNTMMKVLLTEPLKSGKSLSFSIAWSYPITDRSMFFLSREGYEYFPEDDNTVYLIAHWFPRMAVYNDVEGWQNLQFLGRGEFALVFGDYEVNITTPKDHILDGTGVITNRKDMLTSKQWKRYNEALTSYDEPVVIVTQEEAEENEKEADKKTKTWNLKAENVRDFAFASSRKYILDGQAVKIGDRTIMAISLYSKDFKSSKK